MVGNFPNNRILECLLSWLIVKIRQTGVFSTQTKWLLKLLENTDLIHNQQMYQICDIMPKYYLLMINTCNDKLFWAQEWFNPVHERFYICWSKGHEQEFFTSTKPPPIGHDVFYVYWSRDSRQKQKTDQKSWVVNMISTATMASQNKTKNTTNKK